MAGWDRWLVRAGMNRGNARLNSYALDRLQLVAEDRVLEVGLGGGAAMDRMNMPVDSFTPREPDEIIAALHGAGFSQTEIRNPNLETS
ncbi:hypothetical protein [Mesorhizobium sp. 128a]